MTTEADRRIVRELAKRVADIAAHPDQQEKAERWTRLNRLERVRPTIHVQALAPNIWEELLPEDTCRCVDPFMRHQERALRRTIYVWEHVRDDRVIDEVIACPIAVIGDIRTRNFGMPREVTHSGEPSGAYSIGNVFADERDVERIETEAHLSVDWDKTEVQFSRLGELYDGILRVEKRGPSFFWMPVMDVFIQWRGIEQMFIDLIERPAWVHEALERITCGYLSNLHEYERLGLLSPGHANTMLGSGGYAWSDQLPAPGYDAQHVRLCDLWARCATQIFTNEISPAMHEEFAVRYERRLLQPFGLACYGCCEPLDRKMDVVRTIPNLRRVSMSPWVDIDRAAAEVGRDFVYTHKPNPTIVSMETWHPELARDELKTMFEKTRDNVLEVNLQDLHTVRGEPFRLTEWTRIALELAEEYA
jgi:hypothetical protein